MEFYALDLWNLEICGILIAEIRLRTLCAGLLEFVAEAYFCCVYGFLEFQSVKFWLEILSQQNVSHNFGLKFYTGLAWSASVCVAASKYKI